MSDSSSKHKRRHSGIPNNKIMDVALKILLIHFLNCTEKCNRSGCICNRLMTKKSSSANTQTQTVQVPLKESTEHKTAVGSGSAAVDDECIGASIAINLKNSCVTYKSKTLVNMEREANNERKLDTSSQKSNSHKRNSDKIGKHLLEDSNSSKNSTKTEMNVGVNVVRDNGHLLEQVTEEEDNMLMKCLEEMDNIALQLRASSENILSILAVHQKPSS